MVGFKVLPTILLSLLSAVSVTATGASERAAKRDSCVYKCGRVCYWQSDIDAAVAQGFQLEQAGQTVGKNDYPHEFDDREGFDIPTDGPWYEFPIMSSFDVYTGGSPGADRVVFDSQGALDLLVTHNGASGNNFVQCTKQ